MTTLLYLKDTYQYQATVTVNGILTADDGRTVVILDQTIFYPQGGGQPCDTGIISTKAARFEVTDVRLDHEGRVHHFGTFAGESFLVGQPVSLAIDQARREHNAKLHSAGHLIDCAVTELGLAVKPTKGYHFSQGPYVEYEGEIAESDKLVPALQEKIDELVTHRIPVCVRDLSAQEAQAQGIAMPVGKTARLVNFEGFAPCGCGGTHVHSSHEIGKIIVRKIKSKAGNVRISYDVE